MQLTIALAAMLYPASLLGCYDGDTCTVRFTNAPAIIATQRVRFYQLDTPEINGACAAERSKARAARALTLQHMQNSRVEAIARIHNGLPTAQGRLDKYGRLLVRAPKQLEADLLRKGLARRYTTYTRFDWCQ